MALRILGCLILLPLLPVMATAADHPKMLCQSGDRDALRRKIETAPWAKAAYEKMKANVDKYFAYCLKDPDWLSSRLFMNWTTHHTTPILKGMKYMGGEGKAPIPTPRFAGGRDWASKYTTPNNLEDYKPYNDREDGFVYLPLRDSLDKFDWVAPGETGRVFEGGNARILQLAADASFIYWLSGDEKYARFATNIFWTYVHGYSYVTTPKVDPNDPIANIYGPTSFEVIHEDPAPRLGMSYDFLYDFLVKEQKDTDLVEAQFKRMCDRVIEGGNRRGNWNLHQCERVAYMGMVLQNNKAYADGKGRQYYEDIILNADLPRQLGLNLQIPKEFDPATGIWPEAGEYGFGCIVSVAEIAMTMGPAGRDVMANPITTKSMLSQQHLLYPNAMGFGVGDTYYGRIRTDGCELLIAAARQRGDRETEVKLTPALKREIADGRYTRGDKAGIEELIQYVPELIDVPIQKGGTQSRTYFADPLNIFYQQNSPGDPDHALAAILYGTGGGHMHSNGLAVELYGAGMVMGVDPGRGSSYWTKDHGEYYNTPIAHNTVVVNGKASYSSKEGSQIRMNLQAAEPASGAAAMSPNISYAQSSFEYTKPAAQQQRSFAVVRTGISGGFYFDVFRSKITAGEAGYHDYVYHNMGQSVSLSDSAGKPIALADSKELTSAKGNMKGYDYLQDERSCEYGSDFRATFSFTPSNQPQRVMNLFVLGSEERKVFVTNAPKNRTALRLGEPYSTLPVPTVMVRQTGEAWTRPFIAIYEPFLESNGAVKSVRPAKTEEKSTLAAAVVEGTPSAKFTAYLAQDDQPDAVKTFDDCSLQGRFGCVIVRNGAIDELYLVDGKKIGSTGASLTSAGDAPVNASLLRTAQGWKYSASGPVRLSLPLTKAQAKAKTLHWTGQSGSGDVELRIETTGPSAVATCDLPAGEGLELSLK